MDIDHTNMFCLQTLVRVNILCWLFQFAALLIHRIVFFFGGGRVFGYTIILIKNLLFVVITHILYSVDSLTRRGHVASRTEL